MRSRSEADRARAGAPRALVGDDEDPLTPVERERVVATFIQLLEGVYAHLPLKRAMYGIEPVQQLRRLRQRAAGMDDTTFRHEVGDIVRSLRDAHTVYVGPKRLADRVARLPFLIEQYGPLHEPRYMVSKVAQDLVSDPEFVAGVDLEWWNGVPIATAVDRRGRSERGGRTDSGRGRAVESLTLRPLRYEPLPDEHWVMVGYRTRDGEARQVRLEWDIVDPLPGPEPVHPASPAAAAVAVNPGAADVRRAKKLMFNDELWRREVDDAAAEAVRFDDDTGTYVGRFQDNVSGRRVSTSSGSFGYLRLWGFDLGDDDGFVDEVAQILRRLPQNGLIVDLRANPGGLIWAAERILQLFTPSPIQPCLFSLIATEATLALADAPQNETSLRPWRASLRSALSTGELYSQQIPITPPELCNDIGQVYGGPVVAVVDATTYSAGDLFAAGFVDNGIGTLVTIGEATGAGGANVWTADTLAALATGSPVAPGPLPDGMGFTVSIRRATRVGASAGLPIEDLGVTGHRRYALTRTDLLERNRDLIDYCGLLLASSMTTTMALDVDGDTLRVITGSLTRIDVYADGHPVAGSIRVADGESSMPLPTFSETLEVRGFKGDVLKQVRRYRTSAAG